MSQPPLPSSPPRYAIFHLIELLPAWLALTREARRQAADRALAHFAASPGVASVRWFDAEAFSAGVSDVLMIEADDLFQYYRIWERVRDTELFTVPYLTIHKTVVGIEQGHRAHEALGA
jgi:hypothetical protein